MKGIKAEVKTDWKNYFLGDSRGPVRIDKQTVNFKGFNQGDMIFISYHVKWKGVNWGIWNNPGCFQTCIYLSWHCTGPANGGAESGEMDVVVEPWKADTADWTHAMIGKGNRVQPYIDSDDVKAMGGAINKARIVDLVLSEERRAA